MAQSLAAWMTISTAVGIGAMGAAPAWSAEKLNNSLDLVPASASFYSASLRMKEQLDLLVQSKAWGKLMQMPSVQMGLALLKEKLNEPGGPRKQFDDWRKNPDNERLLELLAEMVSTEVFVYGDKDFAPFAEVAIDAFNAARFGPALSKLSDPDGDVPDEKLAVMAMLSTLNDNLDKVVVPDFVLGFKIQDLNKADIQMRRLEALINVFAQLLTVQELKDRFGRVRVGDADFLTLRLDGKLIPWEEIPLEEYEANPGDLEPLKKKLRETTLTISLGVKDGYAILSIGKSNDHLAALGTGDLLADRPEFKPLKPHLSKRLTGIGYISKPMTSVFAGQKDDLDGFADMAEQLLPASPLDEDAQKKVLDDVRELANDLKRFVPEAGASMGFSYLTDRGYETYSYNWGQNLMVDGSQPLSILNHVGGAPLLAIAGRGKHSPEDYDLLVKWIKKGYGYFDEFGVPQMESEHQAHYQAIRDFALPLLERLDKTNRDLLIPGMADGQSALVLDAKIKSAQWHKEMPPGDGPLPMLELALVVGVTDADKVRRGAAEYVAVAQAIADQIHQWEPSAVPEGYKIPSPKSRDITGLKDAKVYWYELPAEAGLDPQVRPALGLSPQFAVISNSPPQVERILKPTPLADAGLLADSSRPLAGAARFDFVGLVEAVGPWIDYGAAQALKQPGADNVAARFAVGQVKEALEILKCFKGASSVTYLEDGATVTRGETVFEDLK